MAVSKSWIRPGGWLARGRVAVGDAHIGVGEWLKRQLEFRDEQKIIGSDSIRARRVG